MQYARVQTGAVAGFYCSGRPAFKNLIPSQAISSGLVSISRHAVYLTPRSSRHHRCTRHELHIKPTPATRSERVDYFGNLINVFTIQEQHDEFELTAISEVTVDGENAAWPADSPAWNSVAQSLQSDISPAGLDAYQFTFESPRVKPGPDFAAYARHSFPNGRPMAEAVLDLTARINRDFKFDPKATTVSTPVEEVLSKRRGVCQDFAIFKSAACGL